MIEIRELVIRATVEDTAPATGNRADRPQVDNRENGNEEENMDMILKIIKEKKER